jgi:hypothetical protein
VQDILAQADRYRIRAYRKGRSQFLAAKAAQAKNVWLGVPVVVTTAIVGTTIFATLSERPDIRWQITTGLLSIAAAVFASLQTFFRYSEAAEKHRSAGSGFGTLYRKFELFLLKFHSATPQDRTKALEDLQSLVDAYNLLEAVSLDVPDSLYDKVVEEQKSDKEGVSATQQKGA